MNLGHIAQFFLLIEVDNMMFLSQKNACWLSLQEIKFGSLLFGVIDIVDCSGPFSFLQTAFLGGLDKKELAAFNESRNVCAKNFFGCALVCSFQAHSNQKILKLP